jgi:NADH-quinone oxidoreductase subunit N
LATAAKVAVFAVLVRFALLESSSVLASMPFVITLIIVACISMMLGSLLALKQNNIKRMLGYSSISHFGYLLALVMLGGGLSLEGFAVYLSVYVVTSLAAFGVVTLMSRADGNRDADMLNDYRGLFWRRPYLASIFTLALFSLAGIPLTAGFIAKFYVVTGVIGSKLWGFNTILFVAVLGSIVIASSISIFFYLRTIISLFLAKKHMRRFDAEINWGQRTGGVMVLGAAAFILVIGIIPNPLMFIAQLTKIIWVAQ